MAFPTVLDVTNTNQVASSTSHAINMPATVAVNDLLVVLFNSGQVAVTHNTPSGWTKLEEGNGAGSGDANRLTWFVKKADGTEDGTTVDFTTSGAAFGIALCYRIDAATWSGTIGDILDNTFSTAGSGNPDATTITAAGSADNLFMVGYGVGDNQGGNNPPTNYTGNAPTLGANIMVGGGWRQLTAASDDPGTFGFSVSASCWVASGIVVPPFAVVGPTSGYRVLEDGVTYRVVEDGVNFRILEGVTPPGFVYRSDPGRYLKIR